MRGIVHYVAGLAAASFVPGVVQAGAAGRPGLFLLGGVAALLPDTLDFKVRRLLSTADVEIRPDPLDPDPAIVADGLASVINHAWDTGRTFSVRLHTITLGAREWLPYEVFFDVRRRMIKVTVRSTEPGQPERTAECAVNCPLRIDYEARLNINILDGPLLEIVPQEQAVLPRFLPWHREWTHSLVFSGLAGLVLWGLWGWQAGLVAGLGHASHVLLDQAGGLGCALWSPLSKRRIPGKQWLRSSDAFANFWLVWSGLVLLYANLQNSLPGMDTTLPGLRTLAWMLAPYPVLLLSRRFRQMTSRRQNVS